MAMNLTLALGLHFDNNAPDQRFEHGHKLQALPATGPVIDILPEPDISSQTALIHGHKLLLTYDFRGLPEPIWADTSTLNIYV